jgi:predicted mannosyl-3-phosphoglycerate phosphatase (HAD superfamily)
MIKKEFLGTIFGQEIYAKIEGKNKIEVEIIRQKISKHLEKMNKAYLNIK